MKEGQQYGGLIDKYYIFNILLITGLVILGLYALNSAFQYAGYGLEIYCNNPECYLTLEECGSGYDVMEYNSCQTKLTSCCQKPHYLLQDNWGYVCQYVFNETYYGG
jgi:hypothetical protein